MTTLPPDKSLAIMVMAALSYMLDTARANGKTVWCLKNDSDISNTSSYGFRWNLANTLALPHVQ